LVLNQDPNPNPNPKKIVRIPNTDVRVKIDPFS